MNRRPAPRRPVRDAATVLLPRLPHHDAAETTVLPRIVEPDPSPRSHAVPWALFGAALVVDGTVAATLGGLVPPLAASTAAAAVLSTLAGFELFRLVGR